MNKILYAILATLGMISCSKNYDISGTIDTQAFYGDKLYLKVQENDDLKKIDSCDVVHGKFHFQGPLDSVLIASVCDNDKEYLPIVIEEGQIVVTINNSDSNCKGTALNDTLTAFQKSVNKLTYKLSDLQEKGKRVFYEYAGEDKTGMDAEFQKINEEALNISKQIDDSFTKFIESNYDNCLGPFVFCNRVVNEAAQLGTTSPWADAILLKAPEKFKKNKDVEKLLSQLQHLKNIENGTEQPDQAPIKANVPVGGATATPAEMSK